MKLTKLIMLVLLLVFCCGFEFNSYQLSKWSKAVRARDGYICYMCQDEASPGHSHHITPKSVRPEMAYLMVNGITLCSPCHRVVHDTDDNWKRYAGMFYSYTVTFEKDIP